MIVVDIVVGEEANRNNKWIEQLEVVSRSTAAVEGRAVVAKWNSTLREGETRREFWCVVPERPSTPKKKKVTSPAPQVEVEQDVSST
jgi:hypothetical protein